MNSFRVSFSFRTMVTRLAALPLIAILCSCSAGNVPPPEKVEKVSMALGGFTALLPELALGKGFFGSEGLEVSLKTLGDGKSSLAALLNDEVDFCTTGEPPLAKAAWERDDFLILGTLMTTESATKVLLSKDSGIRNGQDLRGKRIGTVKGTSAHFFLDVYLARHRIKPTEITTVFLEGKNLLPSLLEGKIDGFAMTERYLLEGVKALGPKARVLSEPGLAMNCAYLVTKKKYAEANPGVVSAFLKALIKAENSAFSDHAGFIGFFASSRKIPEAEAGNLLSEQRHALSFTQPTLLALEDNIKWVREKGLATASTTPNIMSVVNAQPLKVLKPDAVNLFR